MTGENLTEYLAQILIHRVQQGEKFSDVLFELDRKLELALEKAEEVIDGRR